MRSQQSDRWDEGRGGGNDSTPPPSLHPKVRGKTNTSRKGSGQERDTFKLGSGQRRL